MYVLIHIRKLILEDSNVALLGHNLLSGLFFSLTSGEESGLCITLHISCTYLCSEQVRNMNLENRCHREGLRLHTF